MRVDGTLISIDKKRPVGEVLTGFESTYIFGTGKDVLELSRHSDVYAEDLELVRRDGIRTLRYSIPWHRVEREKGRYDWSSVDGPMQTLREKHLDPVADPLHHTSFPNWLIRGFADPEFPGAYLRFVQAFAERFPWVRRYTVMNEPFVTTLFCGMLGKAFWYPYYTGSNNFVPMVLNTAKAICETSNMLYATVPDVVLYHVDACERHTAVGPKAEKPVAFRNELRFLYPDLITGKMDSSHVLYPYLRKHGMSHAMVDWFQRNATDFDVLGLDYYAHNEIEWKGGPRIERVVPRKAVGFAAVALEYVERYKKPVMLTETNIRGTVTDRLVWLKFMSQQCEQLAVKLQAQGVPFRGMCWYPFVDCTDWDTLVKQANGRVDPQGIYHVNPRVPWKSERRKIRNASELSVAFSRLAKGEVSPNELPAYRLKPNVDRWLRHFRGLMPYEWIDPRELRPAANE